MVEKRILCSVESVVKPCNMVDTLVADGRDTAATFPKDDVFDVDSVALLVENETADARSEVVVAGRKIGNGDRDKVLLYDEVTACVPRETVDNAMLDLLAAIAVGMPNPGGAVAFVVRFRTVSVDSSDKVDTDAFPEFKLWLETIPLGFEPLAEGRVRLMSMACVSPVDTPAMLCEAARFALFMISEACKGKYNPQERSVDVPFLRYRTQRLEDGWLGSWA